jgi:hypothetical protein
VELSQALKEALRRLLESGPVKVQENGSWLAPLENFQYEVREKAGATVLHLWTQEGTLVRGVIAIDVNDDDRLALQVKRFGRTRLDHLEFVCREREPETGPLRRQQFRARFSEVLAQQFPDETVSSLTSAPDLEHSLSATTFGELQSPEMPCLRLTCFGSIARGIGNHHSRSVLCASFSLSAAAASWRIG